MLDPTKPIRRSNTQRMIAGVCGGLAEWAGWDVTVVRAIFIVLLVTTAVAPGALAYALLWIVLPESQTVPAVAKQVTASEP
jgi:phage shock protein PspC (stress-responsive transcriptional regulator)